MADYVRPDYSNHPTWSPWSAGGSRQLTPGTAQGVALPSFQVAAPVAQVAPAAQAALAPALGLDGSVAAHAPDRGYVRTGALGFGDEALPTYDLRTPTAVSSGVLSSDRSQWVRPANVAPAVAAAWERDGFDGKLSPAAHAAMAQDRAARQATPQMMTPADLKLAIAMRPKPVTGRDLVAAQVAEAARNVAHSKLQVDPQTGGFTPESLLAANNSLLENLAKMYRDPFASLMENRSPD